MLPQLVFIGAPGSGKGTQAGKLAESFGYEHLSTGDLLRCEVAKKSDLGLRIAGILNEGKLVDDNTVLELLRSNCDLVSNKYIFDGFPRTSQQALLLDEVVLKGASSVAVYFDLDLGKLKERLINRRMCPNCGAIFNLVYTPPLKINTCDKCCKEGLQQRKDDSEEVVNRRLAIFAETVPPILEFYRSKGRLFTINASSGVDATFLNIVDCLEKMFLSANERLLDNLR